MTIVGVLGVAVALSMVVVSHEFGHFLAARMFGVKVLTFDVGFGPVVWKRLIGETEWRLCAIPAGGQVKMLGEGTDAVDDKDKGRSFAELAVWKKSVVVVAGAVGNIILGIVVFWALYFFGVAAEAPQIGAVEGGSPAYSAGLLAGDRVVSVGGVRVDSWKKVAESVNAHPGSKVDMVVERGGRSFGVVLVPSARAGVDVVKRDVVVGYAGMRSSGRRVVVREDVGTALVSSLKQCWYATSVVFLALVRLVGGYLPMSVLAGPIQIAKGVSASASAGLEPFLTLCAFLSVNLGVFNLVPSLPFDGGFLAFFAVEAVRRRPVSEKTMVYAQKFGFALLVVLLVVVLYNDLVAIGLGRGR
jgi:regulator of sigma E protease